MSDINDTNNINDTKATEPLKGVANSASEAHVAAPPTSIGGEDHASSGEETDATASGFDESPPRFSQATALLRQHSDVRWKAVEDSVIQRALALFRPSAPVRGRHELGDFFLAADVIVSHLRRRIDTVPQAAAQKIACTTTDRDELEQVTIQLIAAYGASLLDVAGQVHTAAVAVLEELLGVLAPAADRVRTHVHIGDVSNDPLIVV